MNLGAIRDTLDQIGEQSGPAVELDAFLGLLAAKEATREISNMSGWCATAWHRFVPERLREIDRRLRASTDKSPENIRARAILDVIRAWDKE